MRMATYYGSSGNIRDNRRGIAQIMLPVIKISTNHRDNRILKSSDDDLHSL